MKSNKQNFLQTVLPSIPTANIIDPRIENLDNHTVNLRLGKFLYRMDKID